MLIKEYINSMIFVKSLWELSDEIYFSIKHNFTRGDKIEMRFKDLICIK